MRYQFRTPVSALAKALSGLRVRKAIERLPDTAAYSDLWDAIEQALGLPSPTMLRFQLYGVHRHDGRADVPPIGLPDHGSQFEELLQQLASDRELILLFVDFVLADEGRRFRPSVSEREERNPSAQIRGYWVVYGWEPNPSRRGKNGIRRGPDQMKGSDLSERRYVAIRALRKAEFSQKEACNHVAGRLRCIGSYFAPESINTGFKRYKCQGDLAFWIHAFGHWLDSDIRRLFLPLMLAPPELRRRTRFVLSRLVRARARESFADQHRARLFVKNLSKLNRRGVKVIAHIYGIGELDK